MSTNEQKTIQILLKNKQLLDEVFVISRIIKVEVSVISRAESEIDNTLISQPDVTKTD